MELYKLETDSHEITGWSQEKLLAVEQLLQMELELNQHPRQSAQAFRLLSHVAFELISREQE